MCLSFCSQGGGIPACIAGGIPACLAAGGACSQEVPALWVFALVGACPWGVCLLPGHGSALGGLLQGGACSQGVVETPQKQTATVVDSTHPTGMHSCNLNRFYVQSHDKKGIYSVTAPFFYAYSLLKIDERAYSSQ